ncbi:uncharacterized protein [Euwallacea similis]|uniref:uncharacterized protein n=1 Tax=Euwallacea similis TaxID=1736056 RepID=UPI00344EEBD9
MNNKNTNSTEPDPATVESCVVVDSSDEEAETLNEPQIKIGLFNNAINVLRAKSQSNKPQATICGLLIEEVKLVEKYEKYKGKLFGFTEGIGKGPSQEPTKMASKAVIFMVISHTENWKIPVAQFFVHNPDIKHFSDTIEDALNILHDIGIYIISLTLNCMSPHLSFVLAEELGAEIDISKPADLMKPYFPHPKTLKRVYVIYDLDTILECLKNYWSSERIICHSNCILYYGLCLDVKKVHETDLGNYKIENMCDWIIIRKRLLYDPELLGKTTADAMNYLRNLGHQDFKASGPTIQFLKVLDLMSQISRVNNKEKELYLNLSKSNEKDWQPMFKNIMKYFGKLRSLNKGIPPHFCILNTYITGIIVTFQSFLELFSNHVEYNSEETKETKLPYLIPPNFSLKHIRDMFNETELEQMTALYVFKKICRLADQFHEICI